MVEHGVEISDLDDNECYNPRKGFKTMREDIR
jgi:hypothetical protein